MSSELTISMPEQTKSRGFSLIEVVIALSIFAIGVLAVATMVITTINDNASARKVTEATSLAEDRLERLMALPYDSIAAGETNDGGYTITWDVVENEIVDSSKSITVTVTWSNRDVVKDVTIRHLIGPDV